MKPRSKFSMMLAPFAMGAIAAYFFDPYHGKLRRHRLRDQLRSRYHHLERFLAVAALDFKNRCRGITHLFTSLGKRRKTSDGVLKERVEATLGHFTSHPSALEVTANNGQITLSGPILKAERRPLILSVKSVPGVKHVIDNLEVHEEAGNIPALQGLGRRRTNPTFIGRENWPPSVRVLLSGAGLLTLLRAKNAHGLLKGTSIAGASLILLRTLTNKSLRRVFGVGAGHRVIDVKRAINVEAPLEDVYEFWNRPENFPYFMRNVKEVSRTGKNHYSWEVRGPGGTSVSWDARVTHHVANEIIAWESLPGSAIKNSGFVRFAAQDEDTTTVYVQLSYNPPLGALGHYLATLLGSDPKKEIIEDLVRAKSYLEEGKKPRDAAKKAG